MTNEQVEKRLEEARREDGTFDGNIIAEMNAKGVRFTFTTEGIRWQGARG